MGRIGSSPTDERRPRRMALRRVVRSAVMTCRSDRRRCRRWSISRLAAAREHLDDDHASAAARTGARLHARLVRWSGLLLLGLDDAGHGTEQLAGAGDVGGAVAVGEEAIVPNAVEALGQHVDQEAADELVRVRASSSSSGRAGRCGSPSTGRRWHRRRRRRVGGWRWRRDACSARDSAGPARPGERRLGVDHPFDPAQRRQEAFEGSFCRRAQHGRRRTCKRSCA